LKSKCESFLCVRDNQLEWVDRTANKLKHTFVASYNVSKLLLLLLMVHLFSGLEMLITAKEIHEKNSILGRCERNKNFTNVNYLVWQENKESLQAETKSN